MEEQDAVTIEFNERERQFLSSVFTEVFSGGSTVPIQATLGAKLEIVRELQSIVEASELLVELTVAQWSAMYAAINAVIYGLGHSSCTSAPGCTWPTRAT